MYSANVIRCVLSGSFHRDPAGIERAYMELAACGCQILSPHRMQFIEKDAEFVRDAAEKELGTKIIEGHHLTSIQQADFLWLHVSDGYVGLSSALEVGCALALATPIFASCEPKEEVLKDLVTVVPSVFEAAYRLSRN